MDNNNQTLNKADRQRLIASQTQRDTALTNQWLKNGGITEADLLNSRTLLLHAQKTAHTLLQEHAAFIKPNKCVWLSDFAQRSRHKAQRHRITDKECYAVLNLAKSVNRLLFKQQRTTST